MNRVQFLKAIGISVLAPSVITCYSEGKKEEVPINDFTPNRWPIYPDKIEYGRFHPPTSKMEYVIFTYVKIERNGIDYLVPVKESGIYDLIKTRQRFEYNVKQVQEKFIIDEANSWAFDNGLVIKYDKYIHKSI